MTRKDHLKKIVEADNAYYELAQPIMSDEEYDAIRSDYIEKYGSEDLDYTPGQPMSQSRFKHPIKVTSLGKVDDSDAVSFDKEIERLSPLAVEPKYDGITVVAYPNPDGTYFFVTRGDGIEGDILPWFIPYKPAGKNREYAIRGEAFMTQLDFEKMNKELVLNGEEPKANARNAVAGILNPARKEKSPYLKYVRYICYDVVGYDESEVGKLDYILHETPFAPAECKVYDISIGLDFIREEITSWSNEIRDEGIFPIDGMVMAFNKQDGDKIFGSTAHHIKRKIAVKSQQTATLTTLRSIEWQLGKTGALTPVAVFDPIEILGSTVSRASLSNPEEIKRLGLKIGDEIGVIKAREIIPKVVLSHGGGDTEIIVPHKCPSCNESLTTVGPAIKCHNPACKEKIVQRICFIAGKKVLDIRGLSEETARKIVSSVDDLVLKEYREKIIFMLGLPNIEKLPGFAKKSAKSLYEEIQNAKEVSFPRFIKALCIDGIGEDVGEILSEKYSDIHEMEKDLSPEFSDSLSAINRLESLNGIGRKTAEIIASTEFWEAASSLNNFVTVVNNNVSTTKEGGSITGKTFALTGKMPLTRDEYVRKIEQSGGKVASSVSGKTDFLVIADPNSTSTKAKKARDLGVKLISPEELEKMIG
jgi:NAD-dependent DNA ligase OB-fold domain